MTVRHVRIGPTDLDSSVIALGCMRWADLDDRGADALLGSAIDAGVDLFDHADIYGGGRCEEIFGEALHRSATSRSDVVLQSKCGILPGRYDLSARHIVASAEGSLRRLGTDHLDVFLLHRPDALADPDEIAAAFGQLEDAGKVRHFGVSNHTPSQISLLIDRLSQPIVAVQQQFSLAHTAMIDRGLTANTGSAVAVDRDGDVLDFCRSRGITVQAWSVLQYGAFAGTFLGEPGFEALDAALDAASRELGITAGAVAIAWILRHPAGIQPVVGTTRPERLRELAASADVTLTRERWYELYTAAGNSLP